MNTYIQKVREEMNKVKWPGQDELISNTVVVIIASLALALFIFGADQVLSTVLDFVYS